MAFSAATREQIFKNAGGKCEKCGNKLDPNNWHAHHKNHAASGGGNTASNGRALCVKCHKAIHA